MTCLFCTFSFSVVVALACLWTVHDPRRAWWQRTSRFVMNPCDGSLCVACWPGDSPPRRHFDRSCRLESNRSPHQSRSLHQHPLHWACPAPRWWTRGKEVERVAGRWYDPIAVWTEPSIHCQTCIEPECTWLLLLDKFEFCRGWTQNQNLEVSRFLKVNFRVDCFEGSLCFVIESDVCWLRGNE